MTILSIGSDRNLFNPTSAVSERIKGYAKDTDGYVVIVPGAGKKSPIQLSEKLKVISLSRLGAFFWTAPDKFDLVTSQDPFENGLIAWVLKKRFKAQLELQIHTDLLSPYFTRYSTLNRVRLIIAKFLLPRADKIRVVSERIRISLIDKLKIENSKITVRPIAVDTEKIKNLPIKTDLHQKYPQFTKIILMASRLTKEKNINLAIEAMEEVVKTNSKIGLIIVGSGPEEKNLKLKVKSLKLSESVFFEPWNDDLTSYYKTCDLFLLTSWYEGYGLTLVEAQTAGCKIVSTDVGVASELNGIVITRHESSDLANKILGAL